MRDQVLRAMENQDLLNKQFGLDRFDVQSEWDRLSQERRERFQRAQEQATKVKRRKRQ